MIIVKLLGGLGNQMFQYAAGKSLLKKGEEIYFDQCFFAENTVDTAHVTVRNFELHIFKNINGRNARKWQMDLFKGRSVYSRLTSYFMKSFLVYIHRPDTEFLPVSTPPGHRIIYMDGYFQSESYFKSIRRDILQDFQFPELDSVNEALRKRIMHTPNSVSVHIRRGDYIRSAVFSEIHGVLPLSYYVQALTCLKAKYPDLSLFVFSDDIVWAKSYFPTSDLPACFISHNIGEHSWKDMSLMSFCRHHIIANSSFSWWGAWISEQTGDVFAPASWLNPLKVKFNIRDIIPEEWTVIDYE